MYFTGLCCYLQSLQLLSVIIWLGASVMPSTFIEHVQHLHIMLLLSCDTLRSFLRYVMRRTAILYVHDTKFHVYFDPKIYVPSCDRILIF